MTSTSTADKEKYFESKMDYNLADDLEEATITLALQQIKGLVRI